MGLFFRKSINFGPLRINFSKSGMSYSLGTRGARVNFSNRGTFVNLSYKGIYYRRKISMSQNDFNNFSESEKSNFISEIDKTEHTITTGEVTKISDTDSEDFIKELTEKSQQISYSNVFGCLPLAVITTIIFYLYFSKPEPIKKTETSVQTSISAPVRTAAEVYSEPTSKSPKLGDTEIYHKYKLVDTSDTKYHAIEFHGDTGFVSKQITQLNIDTLQQVIIEPDSLKSRYAKKTKEFWMSFSLSTIFFLILINVLNRVDKKRLTVKIVYEIDNHLKDLYHGFNESFNELKKCDKAWQHLDKKLTYDYKYTAGAHQWINRVKIENIYNNKAPTPYFETNVNIPYIKLKNTELFFFPERILIKRGKEFGAIMYRNINFMQENQNFIEEEILPKDAIVVGHTHKFINKDGTPDRRFNNNHLLPICIYSTYSLSSESGLNELIATSKVDCLTSFATKINQIARLQQKLNNT